MSADEKFSSAEALQAYMDHEINGGIHIHYSELEGYEGMVLGMDIIFRTDKQQYDLQLEWISFGLDLYAENLLESYTYRFATLEELLQYLLTKYSIAVTNILVKFETDHDAFPNPMKDADKKELFEKDWERFQDDFRKNLFLDTSVELIDSTIKLGRFIKK